MSSLRVSLSYTRTLRVLSISCLFRKVSVSSKMTFFPPAYRALTRQLPATAQLARQNLDFSKRPHIILVRCLLLVTAQLQPYIRVCAVHEASSVTEFIDLVHRDVKHPGKGPRRCLTREAQKNLPRRLACVLTLKSHGRLRWHSQRSVSSAAAQSQCVRTCHMCPGSYTRVRS